MLYTLYLIYPIHQRLLPCNECPTEKGVETTQERVQQPAAHKSSHSYLRG